MTEELVALVAQADASDLDAAVEAAEQAYPQWQKVPTDQRAKLYNRLADLILGDGEELAKLESMSMGK